MPNKNLPSAVWTASARRNQDTAQTVETGIELSERQGKKLAAQYLAQCGVPFRVVVRVLSEPLRRRQPIVELPNA